MHQPVEVRAHVRPHPEAPFTRALLPLLHLRSPGFRLVLVEGGASMMVASAIVPDFSNSRIAVDTMSTFGTDQICPLIRLTISFTHRAGTSIAVFEARFGIALLPQGGRRKTREQSFARVLQDDLENRILDFDCSAAALAASRQKSGRPIEFRDTQIAGIALSRHATIATRNVREFHGLKVAIVNPWNAGGR